MKYFAMLRLRGGGITPLVDSEDKVILFDTENEAEIAAYGSGLGYAHGYTVHEIAI